MPSRASGRNGTPHSRHQEVNRDPHVAMMVDTRSLRRGFTTTCRRRSVSISSVTKRKGRGSRVTPSKRTQAAPVEGPAAGAARGPDRDAAAPAASGRYTPPRPAHRLRPTWHRVVGWLGVALGLVIIVSNDAMLFVQTTLLPWGHSDLYLMLGLAVAGSSTWFLGLFDRGETIYG